MKIESILVFVLVTILFVPTCFAQADISARLMPSAINTRIAEIRMGDIIVKTKPGAEVKIQQVRHEFLFGTAIPNQLVENDENAMSPEDRKMFLKILAENFNYAVHENALKWYNCEKEYNIVDYSKADRIWKSVMSLIFQCGVTAYSGQKTNTSCPG